MMNSDNVEMNNVTASEKTDAPSYGGGGKYAKSIHPQQTKT